MMWPSSVAELPDTAPPCAHCKPEKVVLINQGQSALHFSSGSIDVLGRLPDGSVVNQPFDALSALQQQAPEHPYSKVGRKTAKKV